MAENYCKTGGKWLIGCIAKRMGATNYLGRLNSGQMILRHVDPILRRYLTDDAVALDAKSEEATESNEVVPSHALPVTRSVESEEVSLPEACASPDCGETLQETLQPD